MKLPLIAACLVAGSTWSFASADVTASNNNPKTTQKSYHASAPAPASAQKLPASKNAGQSSVEYTAPAGPQQTSRTLAQRRTSLPTGGAQLGSQQGSTSTGGQPNPMLVAAPTNDDCATPDVVAGNGTFAFDTTSATTGTEGQLCIVGSGTGIAFDVWFEWTSAYSGTANISMCGQTSVNTKLCAYDGAGCPLVPNMLAGCNDNGCVANGPSVINVAVVAGNVYMIQVGSSTQTGTWPGGPGTVTCFVPPPIPPPANDDCTASTAISGAGSFAFDNGGATVTAGLPATICGQPWSSDCWFDWTATFTGTAQFETCNMVPAMDTMIAVYAGAGCPGLTAPIACNDDGCGAGGPSNCQFTCVSGLHYELQVMMWGTQPGSATGTFDITNVSLPPANDDCSAATVLLGTGSFPYDSLAATTGLQGQSEAACLFGGQIGIDRDIWFEWTAPISGCTKLANCGGGGGFHDSKMAVYAGAGCPAAGTAIGCNDDFCGVQSGVNFTAIGGQTYMIQLGSYPGAFGATGSLSIVQVATGVGNDECTSPDVLGAITGVFAFDNSAASTGCEGQTEALCGAQGAGSTMENDLWFTWTAPSSGYGMFDTCGLTTVDTRLGVYPGSGCPTAGSAIACRDDSCPGFQTTVLWPVTAGATYTLQLGNYPGALGGTGAFSINVVQPPGACDPWDDGISEGVVGYYGANDTGWMNRFGNAGVTATISSVDVAWGGFLPLSVPNGTPTDVFIWADGPTQDNDPSDATLLMTIPTTIQNQGTNILNNVVLPTPLSITGRFFVGTHVVDPVGVVAGVSGYSVAVDFTVHNWIETSWVFAAFGTGVLADYANLALNALPPTSVEAWIGWDGQCLIRANCTFGPATYTCTPGDPGINPCPCSNPPTGSDRGCNNKGATGGASITGTGSNSLAAPTLVFTTANENPTVGSVLIQGTVLNPGINFGHGIRCAAGVVKRLYVKIAVAGSITAPVFPTDVDIPTKSGSVGDVILAGQTRTYQVYYRDSTVLLPGCPTPANQFNVTNAAQVVWQP